MKNITTFVTDVLCVILVVAGTASAFATAFNIAVNYPVLFAAIAIFSTVFALVAKLVESTKKFIATIIVTLIVYVLTIIMSITVLLNQLNYAVNTVLKTYSNYFSVAQSVTFSKHISNDATIAFVFASILLCAVFALTLIRLKVVTPIITISVLCLIPCFAIIDTLPSVVSLIIVITVLFALFISDIIRKRNPAQCGAVTAIAAAVILCAVLTVFAFNQPDNYEREKWQDNLLAQMQKITGITSSDGKNHAFQSSLNLVKDNVSPVDELGKADNLVNTGEEVMTVKTSVGGITYLKSQAFADYKDNSWSILSDTQAADYPSDFDAATMTSGLQNDYTNMEVRTNSAEPVLYSPYFINNVPSDFTAQGDVCMTNDTNTQSYTLSYVPYNTQSEFWLNRYDEKSKEYTSFVYSTYLQLPNDVKGDILNLAIANQLDGLDTYQTINAVKNYVSAHGTYSLTPSAMPDGKDFATWFLTESDTGYCVHYATATVVMLRALGVPARYVSGYCFNAKSNEWTTVLSDNAHAWAEYYDADRGWIPLDATPSSFSPAEFAGTPNVEATEQQIATTIQQNTAEQPQIEPTTEITSTVAAEIEIPSTPNQNDFTISPWLIIAILLVLLIIAVFARRFVILYIRKAHLYNGKINSRAVYAYRYIILITNYFKTVAPDEITDIATKAKFSNHTVSKEELQTLIDFADTTVENLYKNSSIFKKLYYKLVIVLK